MRPHAVIDAETDPFKYGRFPEPFVWGFYDGDRYEQFDSTIDLARFLYSYKGVVYAHNGGRFDFHFLLPFVESGSDCMLINGRIAKVRLGACELRDSWCILPIPLAGYKKEKISYDIFEEGERKKPHNKKLIDSYLRSDCVYLYELVTAFIDRHGMKITQASAALALAESMLNVKFPNSTVEYFDTFRPYYYGGRVQCFERGVKNETFDVFDINSAYPDAMCKAHPFSLEYETRRGDLSDAYSFPHAFFHIRGVSRGALPWRDKVGAKLVYPSDGTTRDYFVTGWEIQAALDTGAINPACSVESVSVHEQTLSWENFILPLYEERDTAKKNGDEAANILAKLAMNSGYGKQGADPRHYTKAILLDSEFTPDLLTDGVYHNNHRYMYGGSPCDDVVIASRELDEHEMYFYNVAAAASITGCVRAFLWRSLCKIDGPLYCDTDSIACRDGSALDIGAALGAWKPEGTFSRRAIAGRKLYAFWTPEGVEAAGEGRHFTHRTLADDKAEGRPLLGKIASKGALLASNEIEALASGDVDKIEFLQDAPSYSMRFGARFLKRDIRMLEE